MTRTGFGFLRNAKAEGRPVRNLRLAGLLVVLVASLGRAEPGTIEWYKDLDKASSAARESNKPMLLDFWADWCAPCRVMEKEVYSDPVIVAAASQKFLPVQLDFDRRQDLARKYGIEGLPTIVFTDSYGGELFRHSGIIDAKTLTELLRALPADVSEINRLRQILAQEKNNFAALSGLGINLQASGLFRLSNEYYSQALRTDPAKRDLVQREKILTAMGLNHIELQEAKQATQVFEQCLQEFPRSENTPLFLLRVGQAYTLGGAKEKAKARKPLETLIRQYPNSDAAAKAAAMLADLR